jgi:transglutaminase-like putative cysteine protease
MELKVNHHTEYLYDKTVHHSIHEVRLTPQQSINQSILHWTVHTQTKSQESMDAFGNKCHIFTIDTPYSSLFIEAKGVVQTQDMSCFVDSPNAVSPYYLLQQSALTNPSKEMLEYFENHRKSSWKLEDVLDLAVSIQQCVGYQQGVTDSTTTAEQAFFLRRGVCQDHAHVMLGISRAFGLPCRYVSGYFYADNHPDLASHAWVDVCLDIDKGIWHSIDITNACLSNESHIRLAIGRDYAHVAPVKGIRSGGGNEELNTKVSIEKC